MPLKEKDSRERLRGKPSRFDRDVRSPPVSDEKVGLVDRLRSLAAGIPVDSRNKYNHDRRDRDREEPEGRERDDRVNDRDRDREGMRGRENSE